MEKLLLTHYLDTLHSLPICFQITQSKTELIEIVFPNIAKKYNAHVWLSERISSKKI